MKESNKEKATAGVESSKNSNSSLQNTKVENHTSETLEN